MIEEICVFEDEYVEQLFPLALTRPVYDLRCGFSSLLEKILHQFPLSAVSLHCRPYLHDLVAELNPDKRVNEAHHDVCLFINGRLLVNSELLQNLDSQRECIYLCNGQVVATLLHGEHVRQVQFGQIADFSALQVEKHDIEANLIAYPWDLVQNNAAELRYDFAKFNKGGEQHGQVHASATLLNPDQIHVGANASIMPNVVLDAQDGPIYVGNNVKIMPNAVVVGPAFIGENSLVKIGAKIYENTAIGEVCKIGGEVEDCIIHSYSNKQHDGFLGHAYLGQWVNLGADTNNSDLKNNYGSVKVTINGKQIDSGQTFVGLFMGDHAKAGINTMFNTGTVVGAMSNVFGADFPPKYVPSFSWGGANGLIEHHFDRAIATARRVMARRKIEMSAAYEQMLRHVFEMTAAERRF